MSLNSIKTISHSIGCRLEVYASPFVDLIIRLYMGSVFLQSGWLKFKNYLDGNWDLTIYLFEQEHPIKLRSDIAESWGVMPIEFLPANIAAIIGTTGELLFSSLLILGLFGRFAAVGLLFMTAVIEFTYKDLETHYYWALLLSVILVRGAGFFSLDRIFFRKRCCPKNNVDIKA
jgi:putative oxidoreductase